MIVNIHVSFPPSRSSLPPSLSPSLHPSLPPSLLPSPSLSLSLPPSLSPSPSVGLPVNNDDADSSRSSSSPSEAVPYSQPTTILLSSKGKQLPKVCARF